MKRTLLIFILYIPLLLNAQQQKLRKNTYVAFEVGGVGLVASLNASQTVFSNKRLKTIVQAGMGFNSTYSKTTKPYNIPIAITNCFGVKNSFFEAGIGSSLIFSTVNGSQPETRIYLMPIVGYRHESASWFAKIYLSPMFLANGEHLYDDVTKDALNFGLGIGLKLNKRE